MTEAKRQSGTIAFQTEGRLLQELGERLVASPEVALVELIKNAYDADSPSCEVRLTGKNQALIVEDRGMGMTFSDFEKRWMRIATSHKIEERFSPRYRRRLTGQKGIGRFAVRFLGLQLKLDTVALDKTRHVKTRLSAEFDWEEIDKAEDLGNALIPYELSQVDDTTQTGTRLIIEKLKTAPEFVKSRNFRTSVLKIVSPVTGLERGRFGQPEETREQDPGFKVTLPGDEPGSGPTVDIAKTILNHSWARLTIDLNGKSLMYRVSFNDGSKANLRIPFSSSVSAGLLTDIRFFPRRKGIFQAKGIDGRAAWSWVRENHGVGIVDHGFRVKPFGFVDDDWLMLDADSAHNERNWRSQIAKEHFPIAPPVLARPAENPMLNLPSNFQLVGAVFVESRPPSLSRSENDLTPSMDREGFLDNQGFRDVFEIVRGGLEFLAAEDKKRLQREEEARAREAARQVRTDFRAAIQYIEKSPTLTRADKARLVKEYSGLATRLEEVEEYDREARRKLEVMSALGVVAGFMTHEATRIVTSLGEGLSRLRALAKTHQSLSNIVASIENSYKAFQAHLDYTRTFIDSVHQEKPVKFRAAAQVRRVIDKFGAFAKDRGIEVLCEVDDKVEVPAMPVAVYSGVLLNLYSNALKAIIAAETPKQKPKIVFRGWNEPKKHVIEVLDTGIGIPPNLRGRIWDPLFTTTSRLNNPLGSGMGLGLTLVKQLVTQISGKIEVIDAPAGFSTCFRVEFRA